MAIFLKYHQSPKSKQKQYKTERVDGCLTNVSALKAMRRRAMTDNNNNSNNDNVMITMTAIRRLIPLQAL